MATRASGFCCSLGQGGEISSSCLLPRRPQVPRFKNHSQNVFLFPELKLIAELPGGLKNGVEQAVVLHSGFRIHVTRLAPAGPVGCVLGAGAQPSCRVTLTGHPPSASWGPLPPTHQHLLPLGQKAWPEGRPSSAVAPRIPRSPARTPSGVDVRSGGRLLQTCLPLCPAALSGPAWPGAGSRCHGPGPSPETRG